MSCVIIIAFIRSTKIGKHYRSEKVGLKSGVAIVDRIKMYAYTVCVSYTSSLLNRLLQSCGKSNVYLYLLVSLRPT